MALNIHNSIEPGIIDPIAFELFKKEYRESCKPKFDQKTKGELIEKIRFYHYQLCLPRNIHCLWKGVMYSPDSDDELLDMSFDDLMLQMKEYMKLRKIINETPRKKRHYHNFRRHL
jgi:hypothetical protein